MREKGRKASGLSRSRCCRGSGGRGKSVIYWRQPASLSAVGYPLLERVFVTSAQCARAFEILLKSSPRNNTSYLPRDIRFCRSRIDTRQLRFAISLDHQGESNLTTDSQVCFGLEAQYRVMFHRFARSCARGAVQPLPQFMHFPKPVCVYINGVGLSWLRSLTYIRP